MLAVAAAAEVKTVAVFAAAVAEVNAEACVRCCYQHRYHTEATSIDVSRHVLDPVEDRNLQLHVCTPE